jgi:hypothetical protein
VCECARQVNVGMRAPTDGLSACARVRRLSSTGWLCVTLPSSTNERCSGPSRGVDTDTLPRGEKDTNWGAGEVGCREEGKQER